MKYIILCFAGFKIYFILSHPVIEFLWFLISSIRVKAWFQVVNRKKLFELPTNYHTNAILPRKAQSNIFDGRAFEIKIQMWVSSFIFGVFEEWSSRTFKFANPT